MKLALLSVTDKTGIIAFAQGLVTLDFELVSTGGTYAALRDAGIKVRTVESLTGYPEILDGRVKTLNPKIHGGILFRRKDPIHLNTVKENGIFPIDLVCVNLYEFEKTLKRTTIEEDILESIDIGGPTLIRAGAKNFQDVLVVTDPQDYSQVLLHLKENSLDLEYRRTMAGIAFQRIAQYDLAISNYFNPEQEFDLVLEKKVDLSYGENPHQKASLYRKKGLVQSIVDWEQLQGKAMSYNNYNDAYAAMELLSDFKEELGFCGAIKHGTLCGAAIGKTSKEAYCKTVEVDPISIFGGIVAFRGVVDENTALELVKTFLEVVVAPEYTKEALLVLKQKSNLRLLQYSHLEFGQNETIKDLDGCYTIQSRDCELYDKLENVTEKSPTAGEMEDLLFGNKLVKNLKSNGIVLVRDKEVLALCGGQTARVFALQDALLNHQGKDFTGAIMASDAFFPFSDTIEAAGMVGLTSVIQPGGSKNDQVSIDRCNALGMSMVITGRRHFKH